MRTRPMTRIYPIAVLHLAVLAIAGSLAMPAGAQPSSRFEVFGVIGNGWTYDDEGSLGNGLNGGGGIGYRLTRTIGLELEVNGFRTKREFSAQFPPYRANGTFVVANALRYFGRGPVQPYLIGGGGLLHFRNLRDFAGMVDGAGTGWAIDFGAGMKIFVSDKVSVRPDFRIFGGNGGGAVERPFTDVRLSVGAGYHW